MSRFTRLFGLAVLLRLQSRLLCKKQTKTVHAESVGLRQVYGDKMPCGHRYDSDSKLTPYNSALLRCGKELKSMEVHVQEVEKS